MYIRSLAVASVAFSSCLFALSSIANEQSIALEEVVVTARKQEESAQDIPVALTALTSELQNSSIRDLKDITGYSPNVIFEENSQRGGGGGVINIRGISPVRSDDNSLDAPIAVVVDGIYLGSMAGQVMENFDLERVEILRGPQGTLFGKNTVGGVINVIRSRPTGELGGKLKLTAGKDGQIEARAVINTSLSETLAMKFFATDISYDGFMDNITTGSGVGERDYQNYGLTFLFEPNDRFEALLTVEAFRDEGTLAAYNTNYNVPAGLLPAPPAGSPENDFSGGFLNCSVFGNCRTSLETPEFSDNDKDHRSELDTNAVTLKMEYALNDNLTLVSITGRRELDEYSFYDFDASPNPFITIERTNEFEQTSQELRLDGNYDKISFSAGLYYFNQDFTQDWYTGDQFWAFLFGGVVSDPGLYAACLAGAFTVACDEGLTSIPLGTEIVQVLYENQDTTSKAAYAQMDYRFNEKWTLTAGIRWTEEEKDFIAGQAYLTTKERETLRNFPTAFGDNGYADLLEKWTDTSLKLGMTYNINDSSMVYGMFSQGFHSGGFFGVNQNIRDFIRDVYDPETADNYEIGYKSQHLDDRLRFNAVYFYNDFKDKQESFVALDPDTRTVATVFDNAASVKYRGVEIEAVYVFNEYFKGFLNYGSLDAEYDEFFTDINPNDAQEIIQDASFLTPRNAPEFTLGVGGTLTIPVETGVVEAFVKWTRIDEREASLLNLNQARIDETDELSASVGFYSNDDWAVSAYCRNCTDERFAVFAPIATLFAAGTTNRPRSYGMEFTYQF